MKSTKIFAKTGSLALLRDNRIPCIGNYNELGKRYDDGKCILIKCVSFDFEGDASIDRFYFENDKLVYYFICLERESWLRDLLIDAVNMGFFTQENFIITIVECFVLHELGFTTEKQ